MYDFCYSFFGHIKQCKSCVPPLILPLLVHELVHDRVDRGFRVRFAVHDLRHGHGSHLLDVRARLLRQQLRRRRRDLRQQLVLGEVGVGRGERYRFGRRRRGGLGRRSRGTGLVAVRLGGHRGDARGRGVVGTGVGGVLELLEQLLLQLSGELVTGRVDRGRRCDYGGAHGTIVRLVHDRVGLRPAGGISGGLGWLAARFKDGLVGVLP